MIFIFLAIAWWAVGCLTMGGELLTKCTRTMIATKTSKQSIKPTQRFVVSAGSIGARFKVLRGLCLFLVRPIRVQSMIALLMVTSVQFWPALAHAADSAAVGRAYTIQVNDVARRVVIAELVKHPERIHRMSLKCTIQLDRQGHPRNVKVVSSTHNRWAEDTARRALAAATFPPLPKNLVQQSGTDKASFDYQLDLDEPR
jgi:hypothetical protein